MKLKGFSRSSLYCRKSHSLLSSTTSLLYRLTRLKPQSLCKQLILRYFQLPHSLFACYYHVRILSSLLQIRTTKFISNNLCCCKVKSVKREGFPTVKYFFLCVFKSIFYVFTRQIKFYSSYRCFIISKIKLFTTGLF